MLKDLLCKLYLNCNWLTVINPDYYVIAMHYLINFIIVISQDLRDR